MRARIADNQRVYMSASEVRKISHEQYEEERANIFKDCADDIMAQAISVVLWTLATRYEWGRKRLTDFTDALKDTNDLMCNPSKMHHRFSPLDCEKSIKDKYGIDIRDKFKAQVEVE